MKYNFKGENNSILSPLAKIVTQVNMDYEELATNPFNILSSFSILQDARIEDYWIERGLEIAPVAIEKRIPIIGKFKKTSRQNLSSEKMGFEYVTKTYSLAREEISLEVTERELEQNDPRSLLQGSSVSLGGVAGKPKEVIRGSGLAVGIADRIVEKVINGDKNSREIGLMNIEKEEGIVVYPCTVGDLDDSVNADYMKKFVAEIMVNWQAQNPNGAHSPDELFIDMKFQHIIDSTLLSEFHLISAFKYYLGMYAGRKNREVIDANGKTRIEWLDEKDITIKYIQNFGDRVVITKKRSTWGNFSTISLLIGNRGMNFDKRGYVDAPLAFKFPTDSKMFKPYYLDENNRKITTPLSMWWGGITIMQPEFIQCMYINTLAKSAPTKSAYVEGKKGDYAEVTEGK